MHLPGRLRLAQIVALAPAVAPAATRESVRDDWQAALIEGQIWTTPIVVLELLAGARNGE